MRRYVQILGLVVLAFLAGGWGTIMAAALCPHARIGFDASVSSTTESLSAEPACHSVKQEEAREPDCHNDSAPQPNADAELSQAAPGRNPNAVELSLPESFPCTHCMGRPELPASNTVARQQAEQKRETHAAAAQVLARIMPASSFTRPVLYRQGAPPGSNTPKHLLIGVLLI